MKQLYTEAIEESRPKWTNTSEGLPEEGILYNVLIKKFGQVDGLL